MDALLPIDGHPSAREIPGPQLGRIPRIRRHLAASNSMMTARLMHCKVLLQEHTAPCHGKAKVPRPEGRKLAWIVRILNMIEEGVRKTEIAKPQYAHPKSLFPKFELPPMHLVPFG